MFLIQPSNLDFFLLFFVRHVRTVYFFLTIKFLNKFIAQDLFSLYQHLKLIGTRMFILHNIKNVVCFFVL